MTTLLDSMQSRHAAGQSLTRDEVGLLLAHANAHVAAWNGRYSVNAIDAATQPLLAPAPDVQPLVPAVKPEPHYCRWVKLSTGGWHVRCNHGEVWWNSAPTFCHRCGQPVLEMFAPLTTEPEPQEVCEWSQPDGPIWKTKCGRGYGIPFFDGKCACGRPIREVQA